MQANPWDMNPPLGSTPNLVWPTNQSPFMTQGGAPPWPHYNQQSLYPQFMAGHGLPGNHWTNQPQAGPQLHSNFAQVKDLPGIIKDNIKNANNSSNKNANNLSSGGDSSSKSGDVTFCPCCGNMTYRGNITKNGESTMSC